MILNEGVDSSLRSICSELITRELLSSTHPSIIGKMLPGKIDAITCCEAPGYVGYRGFCCSNSNNAPPTYTFLVKQKAAFIIIMKLGKIFSIERIHNNN